MSKHTNARELWRSELGDAAEPLWDTFMMHKPPALGAFEKPGRAWMWMGLAASWLGIALLAAWNVTLQRDVSEAREQAALMLLTAGRSDRVLGGLASIRQIGQDRAINDALLQLLKTTDDPNIQIEALDLLLDDVLSDPAARNEVLKEIRFNREFIELALQSREIRT